MTPSPDEAMPDLRVRANERTLLGALMHGGADLDGILERVRPEDYSSDPHQTLARVIRDLWAAREPVELVTVIDRAKKTGAIQRLGPSDHLAEVWIAELYADAGTSGMAEYHAAEVLDGARKRQLAVAARETLRDALTPDGPAAEMIDRAVGRMSGLAERGLAETRVKSSAEAVNAALDEIDRRARGEVKPGIQTGIPDLDTMTGGLSAGQLVILAARPSVGKTALSIQIARHAAGLGHAVLFASLEQPTMELTTRSLASMAKVCGLTLRLGRNLSAEETQRVSIAADRLRSLPIHYDDTPGQAALHVLSTARRLKRQSGLGLVIVDYLQLLTPDDSRASRNDQLDTATRRVREMARELNVAVLALSQLSRECEKQNRRPRLSDLRDSGALEQHADAVMILHRPERSEGESDPVELGIEKQRNGPTGLVSLAYRKRVLTFEPAPLAMKL